MVFVKREVMPEEFRADALAAWAEYQRTGLHVTAEEADEWLAKLEADEDALTTAAHQQFQKFLVMRGIDAGLADPPDFQGNQGPEKCLGRLEVGRDVVIDKEK